MATIKAIEGRSVHQIQSGQVIVDLQSVCKELVENSIDAGATAIEVRFKNNGLDTIEVQDNGSGIAPDDYATIGLKHYTSKLSSYDDLSSLQTFGFRGEAISSLCALSNFHIVTARPVDGPKGTKLEFEQSGKLKGTSVVAAKQGTTVIVETLFHNLPVRRKELEKNIKREYNKVLQLLNAYACISVGVKFTVSNLMPKGKKSIAFSTNSNSTTKDNISNVYGAKTISALIPLDLEFEMNPTDRPGATQSTRNWTAQESPSSRSVKIRGHISKPVVGEGRQTPDRQMFFVNSRPCNLPQVAKAFNEVYKSYNITQSPFIFADIQLDTNAYDVNVSPDKRTIMLHDQTTLLESMKESLLELFQGHDQSVPQAQLIGKRPLQSGLRTSTLVPRESTDVDENGEATDREDQTSRSRSGSLIEAFAGRDTEDRSHRRPGRRNRVESPPESPRSPEQGRASPLNGPRRSTLAESEVEQATTPQRQRPQSPIFEPEQSASPMPIRSTQPSRIVQDFNARMAGVDSANEPEESAASLPGANPKAATNAQLTEEPIPAIKQTPHRVLSQSTIQNAFDRMRPLRTPLHEATVTVGDTTTVTTIGTGSQYRLSRQARIYTPKFSLSGKPLDQTPKRQPVVVKSLRAFAAPGTQLEHTDEEEGDNEEDEEAGDQEGNPRNRSPSPQKSAPSRALEESDADNLDVSSFAGLEPNLTMQDKVPDDVQMQDVSAGSEDDPNGSDEEYIDEDEKKAKEEAKIAELVAQAEQAAAVKSEANVKRAAKLFKVSQRRQQTVNLARVIDTDAESISQHLQKLDAAFKSAADISAHTLPSSTQFDREDPEERLSLTVTKQDFYHMRIIGQFNLGFIIAVRPPTETSPSSDLFIIDQHASDEKYNFERLSATTTLVSQRLVHPHPLELTAIEEELIQANSRALTANGFVVEMDNTSNSDSLTSTHRAKLTSLPMSREVTFTPTDLEELLALIFDNPPSSSMSTSTHIPRPSKVRKLLASRACRSSVMIGKTLQVPRMREIVRHMGSMDKPWSCPHGRPTMRHLFGLENWRGWREGDGVVGVGDQGGGRVDWGEWAAQR